MRSAANLKASLPFLRRATLDILQRTPSPAERRSYLGAPVGAVVGGLLGKLEAMDVWLEEELFFFLLLDNFRPRTKSIRSIPERLHKRRMTARDAIGEIILSTSFSLRNPGNDTFVTVVLEQCLGITVQEKKNTRILEAGKEMYDGKKVRFLREKGQSQSDLVKIVMRQRGFAEHLLNRGYRRLFGVPLPSKRKAPEMQETIDRLHGDARQFFPIVAEWISSESYQTALATKKLRNDRQFIRGLYMDLLARRPEYEEMRNMRNALQSMADPTPLRAVMAKVILDSGQAELPELMAGKEKEFVRECFLRYLGRHPGQTELPSFVKVAKDPACRPESVVRSLVGSAEYQYY